ncbi:hypothetical protein [Lentzea roselyniae]|uniref:hypothetical protein n=1 Tax=Lentzea roselyniae TaxID=531940 RepID=UPI0031F87BC0
MSLVLTLGGTHTLPAVAAACEEFGVPGVSTTLPWQVYQACRGVAEPAWSFHFCWGLDDIAGAFADMWDGVAEHATVGCLWNNGVQGTALRDPANGFGPTAATGSSTPAVTRNDPARSTGTWTSSWPNACRSSPRRPTHVTSRSSRRPPGGAACGRY